MTNLTNRDLLKELTVRLATDETLRQQMLDNQFGASLAESLPELELEAEDAEVQGYAQCTLTCPKGSTSCRITF